ncbi:uncharacterized protein N7511_009237 [Penicillium nucicola]|uniref:uncharacterized protein n=1 Tax=Penicillium nucicola TaxID=1850975 RepID=UPI002545882A|nr:uncharacterized protein N7511_009237 [Penicillium nucicola]KAJ5747541.1 hypothetical protein N7511_009237 [Penicillium nucicola]
MANQKPTPTILLPDLPPKSLVGIDLITFTSTANFHGIRDLPAGWHFLYTGATETLSLRSGAWFYIGDIGTAGKGCNDTGLVSLKRKNQLQNSVPEIYIWKWSENTESLVSLNADSDSAKQETMRHKANLGSVWQSGGLFRYRSRISKSMLVKTKSEDQKSQEQDDGQDQDQEPDLAEAPTPVEDEEETEANGRRDWSGLTDRISPALLSRVIGGPEVDVDGHPRWVLTSASTADRDADHIPGVDSPAEGKNDPEAGDEREREFGFLPIDLKRTWREGAVGRERTEAAQDRSWALGELLDRYSGDASGGNQVIGELQFTFLMVLTMMNYSCLQQWKRLLELILTSRQAILDRDEFMSEVLRLLALQLQRCDDVDGGLFEIDGYDGGAFLRKLLTKLRQSVDELVGNRKDSMVKVELDKLEEWVRIEYDWELHREAILRRGMLQLEDGEEVEMDMEENDEDEETGEYAPMIVDLGDGDGDA